MKKKVSGADVVEPVVKLEESVDLSLASKVSNVDSAEVVLKTEDSTKLIFNGELTRKMPLSRSDEFENFKKTIGLDLNKEFCDIKAGLRSKAQKGKELAESINLIKFKIDQLNFKLDKQRENSEFSAEIMDEKEFQEISRIKGLKREYKRMFEELRPLQIDIDYSQKKTDNARQRLVTEFDIWYEVNYGPLSSEKSKGIFKEVFRKLMDLGRAR